MSFVSIDERFGNYIVTKVCEGTIKLSNTSQKAICPHCRMATTKTHQKSERKIIDLIEGNVLTVIFDSRKFFCKKCKKVFTEETPFTIGKCKYSTRFIQLVIDDYDFSIKNDWLGKVMFFLFDIYADHYRISKSTYYSLLHNYNKTKLLVNKKTKYTTEDVHKFYYMF